MATPEIAQTPEHATIESIIDDQGGGMSYCSACDTKINLDNILETMICPNPKCAMPLKFAKEPYINRGGQDYP
jgi:hypothetical protein